MTSELSTIGISNTLNFSKGLKNSSLIKVFNCNFPHSLVFSRHFSSKKCPTITVASFFPFFSSDHRAHPVYTTFCALCTFTKSTLYLILNASKASKNHSKAEGSPFPIFFRTMRFSPPSFRLCETFLKIF